MLSFSGQFFLHCFSVSGRKMISTLSFSHKAILDWSEETLISEHSTRPLWAKDGSLAHSFYLKEAYIVLEMFWFNSFFWFVLLVKCVVFTNKNDQICIIEGVINLAAMQFNSSTDYIPYRWLHASPCLLSAPTKHSNLHEGRILLLCSTALAGGRPTKLAMECVFGMNGMRWANSIW